MEYLHSDRNKNHPWVIFNQFLHSRSPHDCDFTLQESNLGDVKEPGFPYLFGKVTWCFTFLRIFLPRFASGWDVGQISHNYKRLDRKKLPICHFSWAMFLSSICFKIQHQSWMWNKNALMALKYLFSFHYLFVDSEFTLSHEIFIFPEFTLRIWKLNSCRNFFRWSRVYTHSRNFSLSQSLHSEFEISYHYHYSFRWCRVYTQSRNFHFLRVHTQNLKRKTYLFFVWTHNTASKLKY